MKQTLLIISLVLLSLASQAYEVPKNFLGKWAASQTKGAKETGQVKIFQRFTELSGHIYSIGDITFLQYPTQEKTNLTEIPQLAQDLYNEKNWKTRIEGQTLILEGLWEKGNRYVRYYVTSTKHYTTVSLLTARLGYLDSLEVEGRYIQEALAKTHPKGKAPKIGMIFNFLGIREAQAQMNFDFLFGGGNNSSNGSGGGVLDNITELNTTMNNFAQDFDALNGTLGGTNTQLGNANQNWGNTNTQLGDLNQNLGNANQNWGNTNTQLGNINQTLGNTNTQLGNANQNWANTNTQLGNANQNWANTNTQLGNANQNWANTNTQLGAANQNWANTNTQLAATTSMVDKNWTETNAQLARANAVAEKLADPKHMFTLAAATSAGAVFGASLANMAIKGITVVAKFAWEKLLDVITDRKGKMERWNKFKEAREAWEKSAELAKNLEKLLDQFLTTQELMAGVRNSLTPEDQANLSRENLVSHLSQRLRKAEKTKKELEDLYMTATQTECEVFLSLKIDETERLINSSTAVKNFLEKQNFKEYNNEMFCKDLQGIMGKLGEAEAALQTYRLNILNAREQWEKLVEEERKGLSKTAERVNERGVHKETKDERISNAKKDYERVLDNLEKEKDSYIGNCKKKKGMNKKSCKAEYAEVNGVRDEAMKQEAAYARDRKIENAKNDFAESNDLYVQVNPEIEDAKLTSYYKWFSDIEEQQYCSTHTDNAKCKTDAAQRFMGPFYVKNRAKVKLKDICKVDQYAY